ncbi:uncharacterized protein METZ01_LOCUS266599, partial [marine metagenome]
MAVKKRSHQKWINYWGSRQGERAEFFCLVVKGIVALETGQAVDHAIAVHSLEPGEVLGWSWFVAPHRWG